MSPDNDGGSLFAKYKKAAAPPETAPNAPGLPKQPSVSPPPPTAAGPRVDDARFAELEAVVNNLKKELAERKEAPPVKPLPPPPLPSPGTSMRELVERLERSEAVIEGLRKELAAQKDLTALSLEQAASKDALKTAGQKIADLASSMEDVKRAVASGGELVVRLERSENAAAELKTLIAAQQAQFNKSIAGLAQKNLVTALEEIKQSVDTGSEISVRLERSENLFTELKTLIAAQQAEFSRNMEGLAQKEVVDGVRLELARALSVFEGLKKNISEYSGEFAKIETAGMKISDLAAAIEELKRSAASEGEVVARLERSENAAAELKTLMAAQQAQFNRSIEGLAQKEVVDGVRLELARALSVFEGLKKNISEYSGELAKIETAGMKISDLASAIDGLKRSAASEGEVVARLERSENAAAELKTLMAAQQAQFNRSIAGLAQKNLASALEEVKQSAAAESELSLRLDRSENAFAELKTLISALQAEFSRNMEGLAQKEVVDGVRLELGRALSVFEGLKKNISEYSGEFSKIETECRKSLGEMSGHVRNIEQKFVGDGFNEYLKDSVSRLNARLAEVETGMYASLSDMSGRLTMNEVLFKKIFAEAEERVKKGVEPEIKDMEGQIKWLRDNVIRLSDDYTVVAERKMRALEGKYSAFEAIARRMDAIDAALKMGGKMGLP